MTVEYIEYVGIQFPIRLVHLMNVEFKGQCENVYIAGDSLWNAIMYDYYDDVKEAVEIENRIYFYCDQDFWDTEPSDDEIIEYLKKYL